MDEHTNPYHPQFQEEVKGVVVGEGNIIYNYFYSNSQDIESAETVDTIDEFLPCPYRGLFHFGPNDTEFFFGREVFIEELYQATQNRNFIPVLGASGSGKSSVVLAGLVPRLQQEGHWQFTHFRPGSDPFHALAQALIPLYAPNLNETQLIIQADELAVYLQDKSKNKQLAKVFAQIKHNYPNNKILLIADQFEELYTLCTDVNIRRNFLDQLISDFPGVFVMTMRTDFLGNALSYPAFGEKLRSRDIKIRSMNHDELTEVIVKPAGKLDVKFEAGLVERILEDVEAQPGNLPLLEFALTELWHQRTGKELTHTVYEKIGEVEGALARHADEKYGNLSEAEKDQVRRIFIQLVRPGEGTEDTRRIAIKGELGEQNWSLVKQLADARLVVTSRNATSQETVEVVHEALICNWGELRGWMDTDRVFRVWQERLRVAKEQWKAIDKDSGSLLRGAALAEAQERLKERPEDLGAEAEFIKLSIEEKERIEKEKENRKKSIIVFFSVFLVGILGLLGFASFQWRQAKINQAKFIARYSLSLFSEDKELESAVEAIRAGKILQQVNSKDPEVTSALILNLYKGREINRLEKHKDWVYSVKFSPNGQYLASGSGDDTIKIWKTTTSEEYKTFNAYDDIWSVDFSPDSTLLVSGGREEIVRIWDVQTGKVIDKFEDHDATIRVVKFSPNGSNIASGSYDSTVKLWNINESRLISTLHSQGAKAINSLSFSKANNTLLSGGEGSAIDLWDLENLELYQRETLNSFPIHNQWVLDLSFSNNGRAMLSASQDTNIMLWDLENNQEIHEFKNHSDWVYSLSLSPNEKLLASGSKDETVKIWDLDNKKLVTTIRGHSDRVRSVDFHKNGQILATASQDNSVRIWKINTGIILSGRYDTIHDIFLNPYDINFATGSYGNFLRIWNLDSGQEIFGTSAHREKTLMTNAQFSQNGKLLVTSSYDKTLKLWDVKKEELELLIKIPASENKSGSAISVAFDSQSKFLAWGNNNSNIRIWNIEKQKVIANFQNHTKQVNSIAFSPKGKYLISGSDDNTIKLWDLIENKEAHTFKGHNNSVNQVNFSSDGKYIVSGSDDNTIKLWDINKKQCIRNLGRHDDGVISLSFSPDSKLLASGSSDNTVKIWNVETGDIIATLYWHNDEVSRVKFSPDGKFLASSSNGNDKRLKVWEIDLNLNSLIKRNCTKISNYLKHNPNVSKEDKKLCDGIGEASNK